MIRLEYTSREALKPLISMCYAQDTALIERYHSLNLKDMGQHTLDACVQSTHEKIMSLDASPTLKSYTILYQEDVIGYMVVFENILYSFAIIPKYRRKEILMSWWNAVTQSFKNDFFVIIHHNNTRCLSFLLKNKMQVFNEKEGIVVLISM